MPQRPGLPKWLRDVGNPQMYVFPEGMRAHGYTPERLARTAGVWFAAIVVAGLLWPGPFLSHAFGNADTASSALRKKTSRSSGAGRQPSPSTSRAAAPPRRIMALDRASRR